MITCTKCNQNKEETEFYKKYSENRLHSYCKACFNRYCMDRWTNTKIKAIEYKGGKCEDCNKKFAHYLYDFHHLDPLQKDAEWTKMRRRSWEKIKIELDKCALLCCMCHRIREYG